MHDMMTPDFALTVASGDLPVEEGVLQQAARQIAAMYEQYAGHVRAARALHVPDDTLDCRACNAHVTTGEPVKWPCPTATALGTPRLVMSVQWEPA